jgi:hypothetical protein
MHWGCGGNKKGIRKLEMGSIHSRIYHRDSVDAIIYRIPGREYVYKINQIGDELVVTTSQAASNPIEK